tara:strand:- start:1313 stop:1924 length:612 start_codon:yes stop_codon:yes gene_type:complete
MKSLSEIETTSKRASRAYGFSWGVAEEVGKNIRLLELFGFPGIKNLNEYFKNKNKKKFESIDLIKKKNISKKSLFCPINLGVNFIDQIRNLENIKNCKFKGIGYPLLFLPFLIRGSDIIGKKILFKFDGNQFVINFGLNILSNFSKKNFPSIAKNVEINFLENLDNFSHIDWKNLYNLSKNTFVDENENLKKSAAGAGLTDND